MKASHRATTSSRHPGKVFETVTYTTAVPIVPCAKCGGMRRQSLHPHAPLLHKEAGVVTLRDCVGAVIEIVHIEET